MKGACRKGIFLKKIESFGLKENIYITVLNAILSIFRYYFCIAILFFENCFVNDFFDESFFYYLKKNFVRVEVDENNKEIKEF
jgi:hypothetical protein